MIYVSSACVRAKTIKESVLQLVDEGYTNIELSGGTRNYDGMLNDLLDLQAKYNLNYLCHNYFPPPTEDFVLNLASLDTEIADKSMKHCINAIDLSVKLNAKKFGVHAGFLINIPVNQIGREIKKVELFEEHKAYQEFNKNLKLISKYAEGKVDLYIENNVLSASNFERFNAIDPFFFTSNNNFQKIDQNISFTPLVDVAHLKVSCTTLNLNFEAQLNKLMKSSDYIHISDNNGKNDENKGLTKKSNLYRLLKQYWEKGKTITLEVYDGLESIKNSYQIMQELNN